MAGQILGLANDNFNSVEMIWALEHANNDIDKITSITYIQKSSDVGRNHVPRIPKVLEPTTIRSDLIQDGSKPHSTNSDPGIWIRDIPNQG